MLDGRVLEASQVEYKPFGKPPLQREPVDFTFDEFRAAYPGVDLFKGGHLSHRLCL